MRIIYWSSDVCSSDLCWQLAHVSKMRPDLTYWHAISDSVTDREPWVTGAIWGYDYGKSGMKFSAAAAARREDATPHASALIQSMRDIGYSPDTGLRNSIDRQSDVSG